MQTNIRLSKSCISQAEKQAVLGVLEREYLGMGVEVEMFEKAIENFVGRPAVCVSTGTAALHLALQACGVGHGDEVLVQSLTYIASFQAIRATGAKPVACDVDPKTITLDISDARKRITKNTKAVMPVHYSGGVGNLAEIYEFAREYELCVVEDAAHAFGTVYQNKKIGSQGNVICFSFDGIKNITSGEGGCVISQDERILESVRDARLLGVQRDSVKRYQNERAWEMRVYSQGWRYHMSNIMAAIGIEQMKRFEELSTCRKKIASLYKERLQEEKSISLLDLDYTQVVPHIFVILLKENNRSIIQEKLAARGIQTAYHYFPNHKLDYFRLDNQLPLLSTEVIFPQLLSLPLHPDLQEEQAHFICDTLLKALKS